MPFETGKRPTRLTVALTLLTLVTGMIEAVSFLGLGYVFTAVMTGNILFIGFGLAGAHGLTWAGSSIALAAFMAGAAAGHWTTVRLIARHGSRWLTVAVIGEGTLLVLAALLALGLRSSATLSPRHVVVIVVLAVTMGARNATTLTVAAPDLPTTIATRALTGLFMMPTEQAAARRLATVIAMFLGAVAGTLLLRLNVSAPLLAAAVLEIGAGALCGRTELRK